MSSLLLPSFNAGATAKSGSASASPRTSAQQTYASDPKFKKYTQQVEKCLNSFENVQEWADCIAFLKQLLKTFQSYMQFKEIPRKLVVAKRLSQCLNPALPTGVHQRALDVYTHILAVLGSEGLTRDLALWSSGLFPFFEYAATSVKPTLLNIFDTYYLPLQSRLRPATKAFILALLPGLEEETGEFFDKVLNLLDRLAATVSQPFFLQNIWLIMLTTPAARGTALNYLSRRLPRLNATDDIGSIVGRDVGLMIRAFSAALEDDNLLVRRATLDILLQTMRMDSAAIKQAQPADRTILMKAATGVVLRRDLSLNRRLYTWLLGPDEKADIQVAYFREHALGLLTSTLKDEMFSPSSEYSESRPFKVFMSLLDKWEIGASLTDALVYDTFKAIKLFVESRPEASDDILMTASTLYEAVEPHIIWKHLLTSIFNEIEGNSSHCEAIRLASFVLKRFPVQDDELETIHMPLCFVAVVDLLQVHLHSEPSATVSRPTYESLFLLEELLQHLQQPSLMERPELNAELQQSKSTDGPYLFACAFYGIEPLSNLSISAPSTLVPFSSAFENMVEISTTLAQDALRNSMQPPYLMDGFSRLLLLVTKLVGGMKSPAAVEWNPQEWLSVMLCLLDKQEISFTVVDHIITLAVALHQAQYLTPRPLIDARPVLHKMINKLFRYLRSEYAVYHVRAVNLAWSLEAVTKLPHVEAILAESMTSVESCEAAEEFEIFGTLWRLTEDSMLPGFRFKIPMMVVLDTLKSDDPHLHRVGETWVRCSLKSYSRVLDPLLFDLLDPSIRRIPAPTHLKGKELHGFVYERPFDQRYVHHLMETLLSIAKVGAQGFVKTLRTTPIRRSLQAALVHRVEAIGLADKSISYLDVLIDVLLRFLQSEPTSDFTVSMHMPNVAIQSASVSLLQAIFARGDMDLLTLKSVEAAVIQKLYFCVHMARLDLQNKLLNLLHSIISVFTTNQGGSRGKSLSRRSGDAPDDTVARDDPQETRTYSVNPLLVQTLEDGIEASTNRPLLQHWLDFILNTISQFPSSLQDVITSLNACLCRQLRAGLTDVLRASRDDDQSLPGAFTLTTDAELVPLLNGLERLTVLSLVSTVDPNPPEDETIVEKSTADSSGLLGLVSNVFASENMQNSEEEQLTARSPGYRALHEAVRVLFAMWTALAWTKPLSWSPEHDSLFVVYNRVRGRCRRILEHLFRIQPAEVFESVVDCWKDEQESKANQGSAFELVDGLMANASNAVHMMCESIMCRVTGVSEKAKKQAINPNLSDVALFEFLEHYLQRLEGPLALQVWGRFLQLVKDITSTSRDLKIQNYSLLRCISVLAEKVTQTTAMEDRRVRKELQEYYGKLLDSCILYVGRSLDQGTWIRRSIPKDPIPTNGRDSPISRAGLDPRLKIDEKLNSSSTSLDTPKGAPASQLVIQINEFLVHSALPNSRRFLMDNDKVTSACSSIFYNIVTPSMKSRSKPLDVDDAIVDIIREMTQIAPALKAWRGPVTDLLNDNRFFNCDVASAHKWKDIIRALFDADKTTFPDLISKVTTAPSSNIFTNREYEMLLRSLHIRRISYVLFTGEKNHFLASLPTVQEKLVDVLKNVPAPIVQSEVYLCIRVLLCRLSPHNLTSFWPVLLTELYQLFEQVMTNLPADGSEDLQMILSACKCLDLLLVLQTEEFQVHQWIFVTDTVDAVYRPDNWTSQAMMDKLAEIAGNLPVAESREANSSELTLPALQATTLHPGAGPMRRPLLQGLRQINSIRDLMPFFSNVSVAGYESVYASGGSVDWRVVEEGLMDDMFDGKS